jgi:membrane-bound lytic murein transglycosylase D
MRGTALSIGQVLIIPNPPTSVGKVKTASYRVMKGDSPYIIAQKHQMDLSTLLRLNRLTPRSTIFPGQILLVKAK